MDKNYNFTRGVRMTDRENRRKRMEMPHSFRVVFICIVVQCLSQGVSGQDLTVTINPSTSNFVVGSDSTLLCEVTTSQSGFISGNSPLSWSSSTGSLPNQAYTVETQVDIGGGVTSYRSRLNFVASIDLTDVIITCSAAIGSSTGSQVFTIAPIIIKPNDPVLTGPTIVKAGDEHKWTCVSAGASIEGPNVYFRDINGRSVGNNLEKNTEISADAYRNLIYRSETTLTASLPAEDAQFLLRCVTIHNIGSYSDQKSSSLSITVLFPPVLTKDDRGDLLMTTENVRTTITCNIKASSPPATSVSWTKDGVPLVIDPSIYEGGTTFVPSLVIKSARESDTGDYICKATNDQGEGSFAVPSSLTVRYPAKFDYPDGTTFTGGAGTTFTLPCNARAVPDASNIRWLRVVNGVTTSIRINTEPRYSGGDAATKNYGLTISPLEPADQDGQYYCEVDNDVSSSTSPRLTLVVNDRPTVTTTTTASISVRENDQFLLSCVVQPLDTLTDLRWERDGISLDTTSSSSQNKYFGGTTLNPSLTVRSATDSDQGSYVCIATNAFGSTAGSAISVTLLYKPRVVVSPQPVNSNGGGTVFLTCAVTANPAATLVYWNKDGARIDPTTDPSKYSGGTTDTPPLIIFNGDTSDSGEYFCIAQNDQGTTFSSGVTVTVTNIPAVTITPTTAVIPEGTISHTFICVVSASPAATEVYWTFNGRNLDLTTGNNNKYTGGNLATPSLTIRNVERNDDGSYVCVALNPLGQGSSTTADLSVTYLPTFTFNTNPIGKQVGTFVTIDCDITANPALTSVFWIKDGVTLNTGDPTKYQGGTVGNPSLTIFKLQTSDTGQYSCQAVNSRGTASSPQVSLTVSSSPSIEDPPPSITVQETQTAVLPCVVTPLNTLTSVQWAKDGVPLDTSNAGKYSGGTTTTPTLTIFETGDGDVGSYACTVINDFGSITGPQIRLLLTYKPRLTVPNIPLTQDAGITVTISCRWDSNPNPTLLYWRKDNGATQLSGNTNPTKYRGGTIANPSLTILSVELSDTGSYQCVAVNSIGTAISTAVQVSVVAIPTVNTGTTTKLTANEGDTNTVLECSYQANPAPTDLYWTKDGSKIDAQGQPSKYFGGTLNRPNLTIRTMAASDKGQYVCHVVNSKGTGNSSPVTVDVRYKPVLTVPTAPITTNSGGNVLLSCSVDSNPAATQVYWFKAGDTSRRLSSDLDPAKYGGGTLGVPGLTVLQTTNDDGGNYFCVAINSVGQSTSNAVELIIQGSPVVTVGNQNPVGTEGDTNLVLLCSFSANPTPSDFYWTKDGSRLDVSGQQSKYNGGTLTRPSLTIRSVVASDRGQYVCRVLNSKGLGSSPTVQLVVRYKPVVSVSNTPITQNLGTNVILSCTVNANPAVSQVYWTKNGSPTRLSSASNPSKYGGSTALNPSLTIFRSTTADSGNYVCNARNDVGLSQSNSLSVNIEGQPSVTVGDANPRATEGDTNLVLQCGFDSNPAPNDLYWTKDGSRIDTASQSNKYLGGTVLVPSLTIRIVAPSDRGQYVCHVVNAKGTGSSPQIQLDVQYKPILSVPLNPVSVPAGTPVTLTCSVDSNPNPSSLYWAVFGQRINLAANTAKYNGGTVSQPNLSIVTSGLIDSGDYTCVVTNSIGTTTSKVVSVSFTSVPRVSATVPSQAVPEGSVNVALSCDFQSVPSPEVLYWTKGGSQINSASQPEKYSGGTLTNPTLTIRTIEYTDGDSYVCNVRNIIGTGSSAGDDLNVTYKPRLTVSNSAITSSPGTTVTLGCQIDANPNPTQVYWTKDSVTVNPGGSSAKYRGGNTNNPTLSILSSSFTDNGNYACVAGNSLGLTVSKNVLVSITNVPVVTVSPESRTVQSGTQSLQITCSHISNPSATRLYWTKAGVELDTVGQPAKYSGGTLGTPSLVIRNVDKNDRGTYVCNVVNALGTGTSTGSVVDVTFKPDLVVPTTPIQGSTGSPITLTCSVDSNPPPTSLYWTKDGVRIVPTSTPGKYSGGTLSTPSLTILSPTFGDTASYSCVVVNPIGTTTGGPVNVNIISIPSVTASLTVSTAQEGATNIVMTCNYQANPTATDLYWTKDGVRINPAAQASKYSGGTLASTPNLTIRTVERTDKGTYICRVTNNQGTGSSLGLSLDVTYKPILAVTSTPLVSEPGNSVTLSCSITANPRATTVYWIKQGGSRVSANTNPAKYDGGTVSKPSLTILNTDIGDTGSYLCVAINSIGTTTSNPVSVGIVAIPTVTSTSTVSSVPEGATNIVFTCSFNANPDPTDLFWTKNDQRIDVSSGLQSTKYIGGTLTTPSLTIRTVNRDDRGSYKCHVVNSRGTGISNPDDLDVTFKPSITSTQGNVIGETGQQVTLTCKVAANPTLTVLFWTKAGIQLNLAVPAGKYTGGTIAEPDLTISNLDASFDPASYRCTATNPRGTTVGDEVQLGVNFDPVVNIGSDVTAREGDTNVLIQCDVQMFPAATSVTWTKDGSVLQVASNPSKYSGGNPTTPSLNILTVGTTDAGVYRCSANNGDVTKDSVGSATLTVTYLPKIDVQSPREARVGTSVTLPCSFSAIPTATSVEWKRKDISSSSSVRVSVTGSRYTGGTDPNNPDLTINAVTVSDTAEYICIVTNSRGFSEGSVIFNAKYPPQTVQVTANPTSLQEGSRFVLTCRADGYPEPSPNGYVWYRGTETTPVVTGKSYTKNAAQPADNANFRCDVSNEEGTTSNSSSLDVRFTPISNRQGRLTVSGTINTIKSLTCDVTANPDPTSYAWYKGGVLLVNRITQTITVTLATTADFGDYSCTATNPIGTLTPAQEFTITESAGPDVGASTEDDSLSTTTIILIVIIIIIVLIVLILIIIFCCLQGTCARCCPSKEKTQVAPAVKPLPPPMYANGGYFGPVVTPAANGKLRLNDDEEYASPRRAGAGPIISVPENHGGRAHHLPPLNLDSEDNKTPREERRRSRKKKRRRRGEDDETHLTGRSADRGEEEVEVTNVYSNRSPSRHTAIYEEV